MWPRVLSVFAAGSKQMRDTVTKLGRSLLEQPLLAWPQRGKKNDRRSCKCALREINLREHGVMQVKELETHAAFSLDEVSNSWSSGDRACR